MPDIYNSTQYINLFPLLEFEVLMSPIAEWFNGSLLENQHDFAPDNA